MIGRQYKTGYDRRQGLLPPPRMDAYVTDTNPVRDVEALDMAQLGFKRTGGG